MPVLVATLSPTKRLSVHFESQPSLVVPGIFETKVVKSRFHHEPTLASEIEECTRKTRCTWRCLLMSLEGLFYFLWCVWTLLHIRQIPSTQVYKIPRRSFYDVFEIPKAELLVDDLSFFFDTPAGDYPSKNRLANFLETRDHDCWLHLCTRTNKYLFIGPSG